MFKVMPAGGASAPRPDRSGIKGKIMGLYYDPFKWSLVKSVGFFLFGIRTARDFIGFDVLNPAPQ
ncbi:uncharacterized protein LOC143040177 [Oratosquilla oratoria]|uniref:uncharacterized protein LOC143040177 n=1 Tax=Oratosquilla oratoria TaxID=337810 RepID=UPI003F771B5E